MRQERKEAAETEVLKEKGEREAPRCQQVLSLLTRAFSKAVFKSASTNDDENNPDTLDMCPSPTLPI